VKSAAYIQSWHQEKPSPIKFSCRKTLGWDATTGQSQRPPRRHADVYVFPLLHHTDQATINPIHLDQWCFHEVPTTVLDARQTSQDSITLASPQQLSWGTQDQRSGPVDFATLGAAVHCAGEWQRRQST